MEENNTIDLKKLLGKISSVPKEDSSNMWLTSLLAFLIVSNAPVGSNNTLLEKEVSYLRGKIDTLEKILLTKDEDK